MDDLSKVYISFQCDYTYQRVKMATAANEPNEVRRIHQAMDLANEIWKSWVLVCGGEVIGLDAGKGCFCINTDHIEELNEKLAQYSDAINDDVSMGVGLSIDDAEKALEASLKHKGQDKITFYSPDVEEELQEPEESAELDFLTKAEHPLQNQFSNIIKEQEEAESAKRATEELSSNRSKTKAQVVQILQSVKNNAKELETLKQDAPHLYQSIQSLIQALIMVGRELQNQPLNKSEGKAKHFVMHYPIGFLLPTGPGTYNKRSGGRIKVMNSNGKTVWRAVRAGLIQDPEGVPTSSRHQSGGSE